MFIIPSDSSQVHWRGFYESLQGKELQNNYIIPLQSD